MHSLFMSESSTRTQYGIGKLVPKLFVVDSVGNPVPEVLAVYGFGNTAPDVLVVDIVGNLVPEIVSVHM